MGLRVTVVQPSLAWENPAANREHISRLIEMAGNTDVILLPEMFTTGFTMSSALLAEEMDGPTVTWMREKAEECQAVLAGSLIIRDNGCYFNRLVWAAPGQGPLWYDKRHLFTMGGEPLYFTPGQQRVTMTWKGWNIRLLICYDLRFPVWSRNHDGYDLLIYVANWPAARHHVWKALPLARAIENQCYCLAVNRVGSDGMGLHYLGDSMMITPKGDTTLMGDKESVHTFSLSLEELQAFRDKFPVLNDKDRFGVLSLES
jgi:predicted amidohydrolase